VNVIPNLDTSGNRYLTIVGTLYFARTPEDSLNAALRVAKRGVTAGNTVDGSLKTPYSYTLDLSVGRQLGHDFSIESPTSDASPTASWPSRTGTAGRPGGPKTGSTITPQ